MYVHNLQFMFFGQKDRRVQKSSRPLVGQPVRRPLKFFFDKIENRIENTNHEIISYVFGSFFARNGIFISWSSVHILASRGRNARRRLLALQVCILDRVLSILPLYTCYIWQRQLVQGQTSNSESLGHVRFPVEVAL